MLSTDYTISPDEITALENYTRRLEDESYYSEELKSANSNPVALEAMRQLLQFFKTKLSNSGGSLNFEDRYYNFSYLLEEVKHDYGLKVTLHDQKGFVLHLTETYSKSLEQNNRHQVLKKPLSEMTGYDLYRLAMYVLQDLPKR